MRRDNCRLVSNVIQTCLNKLLIDRDVEGVQLYVSFCDFFSFFFLCILRMTRHVLARPRPFWLTFDFFVVLFL